VRLIFDAEAWSDYLYWQANDPQIVTRINDLIKDSMRSPFRGIGKPEPLRNAWSGWWSRRIHAEHRLVYRVAGSGAEQRLEVAQCRYHY